MIRNIVFDMGMVLLIYNPMLSCLRHAGSEEEARRVYEAIFMAPEWVDGLDRGAITEEALLEAAQSRLDTPRLRRLAADVMADWHLDALWPKEGMDAVIESLLARGYRLYVLSNAGTRFHSYEYKIPHLKAFSGVLISAEERLLKPDPEIYRRLCDRFSLTAEECLFIDDVPRNVEGAEAVGMTGYCYADGDVKRLSAFLASI